MATINFDEVKKEKDQLVVLDVRGKDEIAKHGAIPGSKNLPFTEFEEALELKEDEFSSQFGFPKPPQDAPIVTHCMMGGRALKALNVLQDKGYKNVRVYSGSFKDWVQNGGEVVGNQK